MKDRVVHMWDAGMPQAGREDAGYPQLESAEHVMIFDPTREDGAYNHHPSIAHHGGRLHTFWSNHLSGEDGPGQRVLYSQSVDGRTWSAPTVLFEPPGPVTHWHGQGLVHTAAAAVVIDETLYAVALLHENIGFTDFDRRLPPVPERDKEHPARARKGYSPVARAVGADGTFGPVFPLRDKLPADLPYPITSPRGSTGAAAAIDAHFRTPLGLPRWDFEGEYGFPPAWDGHRIVEPVTYRRPDGGFTLLGRDSHYSHRMFVSEYDKAGAAWQPAEPTDIPDSPSLSCTLSTAKGTVLLIGNQCAPEFDNAEQVQHYDRLPLTVSVSQDGRHFAGVRTIRTGRHDWSVPQTEVGGRSQGYQYPDACIVGDRVWVVHSIGKERIAVSSVELDELMGEGV